MLAEKFVFDDWQQDIIDFKGSITLRSGRQVGKSTTVGKRCAKLMQDYPGSISLIIAPAQRQSSQLFIKVMSWLQLEHFGAIQAAGGYHDKPEITARRNAENKRIFEQKHGIFKERPTKTTVLLKNGSICYALPAGKTGVYLRTYTLDFLYIDEAAYVPEMVYKALEPMLAIAKKKGLGWEVFSSTPFGKGGFFYDSFDDDDYKQFHKSSEDCGRITKEFLSKKRKTLSRIEYAQEYLGEFIDEFNQFFPTALIKKRMTFMRWDFKADYKKSLRYFLGIDLAQYGQDENAFVFVEMDEKDNMRIVHVETSERKNLAETYDRILRYNDEWKFNRIFIDPRGIGAGVTDFLIKKLGRRVVGLDNAKKTLDKDGRTGKIFKEDLYSHASWLLETDGKLELINSLKLLRSLKNMTFKYTSEKNLIIYGNYSHLAEAFVRACWAPKAKSLKLYIL